MTLLDTQIRTQLEERLRTMTVPVDLRVYTTGGRGSQQDTLRLLHEVAALHRLLTVTELPLSGPEAQALGLTQSPTLVLREQGSGRRNIRFVGMPAGYEFSTLIDTLLMLGTGHSGLPERLRADLAAVTVPVHMQAFVTPGCPYCPRAVLTAYRFAFENAHILAEGVEATGFPHLADHYRIGGVPDTVIEGVTAQRVLGGQPERAFLQGVLKAARVAA
ncbi:thioredoxin family protein [Deinococcus sp. MIMF12]|uniref:Thioredoxin family protein n=1 Tax=Deinococcus rhizophilus TaxID=3049544 RepID=A0ABT7JJY8_9DEIO|nr:thioredoxin family protein [Deinococcus rhizophilus]MDL2345375.1 thioredoxin family protein [Deinococcus rhizophilus]